MLHESIEAEFEEESTNNDSLVKTGGIRQSLTRIICGDLYIIGRLWIEAMKSVLVGAEMSFMPVVYAAKPASSPEKPPPMKYTDLPIYKAPHYEYKDYLAEKEKCPKANTSLLQEFLLPYVRSYRRGIQRSYRELKEDYESVKNEICCAINTKKKDFKKYMRDPENLQTRKAVVAMGGFTGFYLSSGRGVPRRLFFTTLGVLATGALCFPKETDEAFRSIAFCTAKCSINLYNKICGKHFSMRERLPCKEDMPPPSKPRKTNPCPSK